MARPTDTPRGLLAKKRFELLTSGGLMFDDYSTSTDLLTANSTALKVAGCVVVKGQTTYGLLNANATALILPNSVRIGTKTTYLSSNSTGVKLGSLYISCNSTGNTAT